MDMYDALELLWPPDGGAASTVKLAVAQQLAGDLTQPLEVRSITDAAELQLGAPLAKFLQEAGTGRTLTRCDGLSLQSQRLAKHSECWFTTIMLCFALLSLGLASL